MIDLISVI